MSERRPEAASSMESTFSNRNNEGMKAPKKSFIPDKVRADSPVDGDGDWATLLFLGARLEKSLHEVAQTNTSTGGT